MSTLLLSTPHGAASLTCKFTLSTFISAGKAALLDAPPQNMSLLLMAFHTSSTGQLGVPIVDDGWAVAAVLARRLPPLTRPAQHQAGAGPQASGGSVSSAGDAPDEALPQRAAAASASGAAAVTDAAVSR